MSVQKIVKLTREKLQIMFHLMEIKNADFRKQEYEVMAQQISEEFDVCCTVKILEDYCYSSCNFEDWELESRKVEHNYHYNSQYYEDRNRH
tara:strand:- start:8912 stop:9184 length:273 start_codon:yes stop_codon:yes gene_type:complete